MDRKDKLARSVLGILVLVSFVLAYFLPGKDGGLFGVLFLLGIYALIIGYFSFLSWYCD